MEKGKGYYPDLGSYLAELEAKGKLIRVAREINKDTELMPLVRWQFRGLPESERKAFLFERTTDAKGNKYSIPVAVATHGASREVYALAINCQPEEIYQKWLQALSAPIEPVVVKDGPVQEVIESGADLNRQGGGIEQFPIPISTPGYDPAPFLSSPCWVTKDPETGVGNVGTYRSQIKSRTRVGMQCELPQHLAIHWRKAKEKGKPLEAAIVIGGPPSVGLVSISKVPYETDELAVAGGIAGQPLPVVKCKTLDLEVPAFAEIVIEGIIPTAELEPEGPFGEYTGYMGQRTLSPYLEIKCISHRRAPIFHAFISQFPPCESSKISSITHEAVLWKFLKYDCNIPGILEVAFHECCGSQPILVIRMKKVSPQQPWQALDCAAGFSTQLGKIIVAVDEDINARDPEAVLWAMAWRMQPHLDVRISPTKKVGLDPSAVPPARYEARRLVALPPRSETSALLIDATRKWDYPPLSLPKKEFMERAKIIWEELGLPNLVPQVPWYGYSLGLWGRDNEEEAELAVKGEHYQTGEKLAKQREKC